MRSPISGLIQQIIMLTKECVHFSIMSSIVVHSELTVITQVRYTHSVFESENIGPRCEGVVPAVYTRGVGYNYGVALGSATVGHQVLLDCELADMAYKNGRQFKTEILELIKMYKMVGVKAPLPVVKPFHLHVFQIYIPYRYICYIYLSLCPERSLKTGRMPL